MATIYEWGVLTIAQGADPECGSDFDGHGPRVGDLRACIALAQQAIAEGGAAVVRLTRDSGEGFDHERYDVNFTLGQPAPLHWEWRPNWPIPKRFVEQWNRHGAGGAA